MIDLEERLRRAAQLLDHQEAGHAAPLLGGGSAGAGGRRSSSLVRVAAAAVLVLGGIGLAAMTLRDAGSTETGSEASTASTVPSPETVPATSMPTQSSVATGDGGSEPPVYQPSATLPPVSGPPGVPVTVAGNEPTEWYRLQPDLEVAWYSGSGESMVCFRSPSIEQCQVDQIAPTELGGGPVGVAGGPGQFLIVTVALEPVPLVDVAFDDGSTVTALSEMDPQIGWSVARVSVRPGAVPVGMSMAFWFPEQPVTEPTLATAGP
ncbi:MAG: hypothetical protein AAB131_12680 [Actinomycetota bacterium]